MTLKSRIRTIIASKQELKEIKQLTFCGFIELNETINQLYSMWNHKLAKRPLHFNEALAMMEKYFGHVEQL